MASHDNDLSNVNEADKSSIEKSELVYNEKTRPSHGRSHSQIDKAVLNSNVSARYVGGPPAHFADAHGLLNRIKNPLLGIPKEQLMADVEAFAEEKGVTDIVDLLKRGALVAQDPSAFETLADLSSEERTALEEEVTHKWRHPLALYVTIITCSIGAAVQ